MSYFKVLLLDGIDPAGVDVLKNTNSITPIVHDKIARDKLLDIVGEADVLVRSATSVDRELLSKATWEIPLGTCALGKL